MLDFADSDDWIEPLDFAKLCLRLEEKCPHLEELILINSRLSNSLPAVLGCTHLLQDVQKLIFKSTSFLYDRSIDERFGMSKVKILELHDCYFHSYNGSPFSKLPHLKQLHLHGTFVPDVLDSWFEDDTSFLNQLHVLIVGRTLINSSIFSTIQNHSHNLKELHLCSSFIRDLNLNFNNSVFPHLKTICLSLTYVTCEDLVSLIQSCPSLENIYVSEYVAVTFAAHPFVDGNRCKLGIVKAIGYNHIHNVNESNDDALNINSLPNEIVLKIFGYLKQNELCQIARVCRSWNVLTKSPVLWKKVHVKFFPSHGSEIIIFKSFINRLPSCVTSIRIDFTECEDWTPVDFVELCVKLKQKCPHLEELILNDSNLSISLPSVIDVCTQFLHNVKNLVFRDCIFPNYSVRGELGGISKIEVLDLSWCNLGHFSKPQFSRMPYLKVLCLYYTIGCCSWFEDDTSFLNQLHVLNVGYAGIVGDTFPVIQNHGLNLKELYFCCAYLQDHDLTFNNSAFPHLKTICLSDSDLTCDGLVSFIQSCPSLKNVYVDEHLAESFAAHPFVVANKCKAGIVKATSLEHKNSMDYSHS